MALLAACGGTDQSGPPPQVVKAAEEVPAPDWDKDDADAVPGADDAVAAFGSALVQGAAPELFLAALADHDGLCADPTAVAGNAKFNGLDKFCGLAAAYATELRQADMDDAVAGKADAIRKQVASAFETFASAYVGGAYEWPEPPAPSDQPVVDHAQEKCAAQHEAYLRCKQACIAAECPSGTPKAVCDVSYPLCMDRQHCPSDCE